MSSQQTQAGTTTAKPSSSSLRPRTQRLISGLEDPEEFNLEDPISPGRRGESPFHSPFGSRASSPIPKANPSRSASARPGRKFTPSGNGRVLSPSSRNGSNDTLGSLSKAWGSSWSALQGIASDLLNPEAGTTIKDKPSNQRKRSSQNIRSATSAPVQWGPSTSSANQIGAGSKEERDALVRARRRQDLLEQAAGGQIVSDSLGRIKRRTSDDRTSSSAPPGENEDRDALVYLHHVSPSDTMAGITIKYNCQAAILRKANRLWPSDTPQARKTLIIPVDACSVKGKPTAAPREEKPINNDATTSDPLIDVPQPEVPNGWLSSQSRRRASSSAHTDTSSSTNHLSPSNVDSPSWTHDSWVLLPSSDKPVEIARLPRRTLGFFPPARRKSIISSASDADLSHSFSALSSRSPRITPTTSLDLPRPSISPSSSAPHSSLSRTSRTPLPRRGSNSSNAYYPPYILGGPGGVGTMGSSARIPGPAQDSLNRIFAPHLPNVAPPPNQQGLYLPHSAMEEDEAGFSGASAYASGTSTPGTYGSGMSLEEVGGKIEGWMRKMATRAAAAVETAQGTGKGSAHAGSQSAFMGTLPGAGGTDLIELNDAFEIGGDEEEERERESRGLAAQRGRKADVGSTSGRESGSGVRPRARSGAGKGKED